MRRAGSGAVDALRFASCSGVVLGICVAAAAVAQLDPSYASPIGMVGVAEIVNASAIEMAKAFPDVADAGARFMEAVKTGISGTAAEAYGLIARESAATARSLNVTAREAFSWASDNAVIAADWTIGLAECARDRLMSVMPTSISDAAVKIAAIGGVLKSAYECVETAMKMFRRVFGAQKKPDEFERSIVININVSVTGRENHDDNSSGCEP